MIKSLEEEGAGRCAGRLSMCQKFVVSRFTTFPLRALGALQPLVFVAISGGFVFQFFLHILLLVYNFVCFGIVVTSLGGRACNFSS